MINANCFSTLRLAGFCFDMKAGDMTDFEDQNHFCRDFLRAVESALSASECIALFMSCGILGPEQKQSTFSSIAKYLFISKTTAAKRVENALRKLKQPWRLKDFREAHPKLPQLKPLPGHSIYDWKDVSPALTAILNRNMKGQTVTIQALAQLQFNPNDYRLSDAVFKEFVTLIMACRLHTPNARGL